MTLNPKVPTTKATNSTLLWSPKGLSLNLASANTWTGAQIFNSTSTFNTTTYLNSWTYNYGTIYSQGTFTNVGTFTTVGFTCSGKITANGGFLAQGIVGSYSEYPYAYNYQLDYYPIAPGSIGGSSNDGGTISDDGLGHISSSYYGQIATIDYNTGYVTDTTSGNISTNYVYYTTDTVGGVNISQAGIITIEDDYNTITMGGGTQPAASFTNIGGLQTLLCTDTEAASFYNTTSNAYTLLGTASYGLVTDAGIHVIDESRFEEIVYSDTGFRATVGGIETYTENSPGSSYYLANTPVVASSISGTASDGGTITDDGYGTLYTTTSSGSTTEYPNDYSYQLGYTQVTPNSISGSASDGGTIADDGSGNLNSIFWGGTTYDYPYTYSYQLAHGGVSPGSIGGYASDGGNLSDDSMGNISSSYYGQIATIDYNTGYVTDITSNSIYTQYISYSYSTSTPLATINYITGYVTDISGGMIYTTAIGYNYGGSFVMATIDYPSGYVNDSTGGSISTTSITYNAGQASSDYSEITSDGAAYFIAGSSIVDINDGTYALKIDGNQVFNTGYIVDNQGNSAISIDSNARVLYWTDGSTPMIDWSKATYSFGVYINTLQTDNIFPANNTSISFGSGGDGDIYFSDAYAGGNGGGLLSISAESRTLNDTNGGAVLNWSNTIGLIGGSSPTGIIDLNLGVLKTYITSSDVICLDFYNRTLNDNIGTAIVTWGDGTYSLNVTGQNYFHDINNTWDMYFFNSAAIEATVNGYGKTFSLGHGDYAGSFSDQSNNNVTLADGTNAIKTNGLSLLGDGGTTNYTQFDAEGHQTMAGTAQPWEDLRVEPQARTTGVNSPTFEKWYDDSAGTSRGVYLYSFDNAIASSEKEVFFTMQMPHAWNGGDIMMHVHWVPAATENTTDVVWGLEYTWKDIGEVYGDTTLVTSSTTLVPDDANITAGKHYISTFTALTPGSTADGLSSVLIGRLYRNSSHSSDTYTNKVGLLYIDAHYQMSSIGSNDEYQK